MMPRYAIVKKATGAYLVGMEGKLPLTRHQPEHGWIFNSATSASLFILNNLSALEWDWEAINAS